MLDFAYDPPNRNPGKPWKWMIMDSLIIAGIAFLSALPSDRFPTMLDAYVALKAFTYSFLVQVAVERGLKPYLSSNKESLEGGNK
jgi:hypothetical protein